MRRHADGADSSDRCVRRHDNCCRRYAARMHLECLVRSELDYGIDTGVRPRRGEPSDQRRGKPQYEKPTRKHPRQRRPCADKPGRRALSVRPVVQPANVWSVRRQRHNTCDHCRRLHVDGSVHGVMGCSQRRIVWNRPGERDSYTRVQRRRRSNGVRRHSGSHGKNYAGRQGRSSSSCGQLHVHRRTTECLGVRIRLELQFHFIDRAGRLQLVRDQ